MTPTKIGRREVLGMMLLTATALSPVWLISRKAEAASAAGHPYAVTSSEMEFFSQPEVAFLNAAVDRLIPKDETGPGAREAGVVLFLDRQMAGPYGRAESWYMQPPFAKGDSEQGYQSPLSPGGLYRKAIAAINAHCRKTYQDKLFHQLPDRQQDEVLSGLEADKVKLEGVSGKSFFKMFLENTIEGFFSDPLYGGNRDFAGWKLIGFPGPRYNYKDYIEQYGKRYPLPTVGLLGRHYPEP